MRTMSEHKFLVLNPSQFRLYINTMGSAVKVRYSILNHENAVVHSAPKFHKVVTDYQAISMDEAQDFENLKSHPFTLKIEYEHILEEHESEETPCPMIELHFALRPIEHAQNALKCTAG